MSTICRAMSSPQRAWASFVLAPRWGQLMTLGCSTSEWFLGGSCSQKHKDNGKLNNNISLFNKKKSINQFDKKKNLHKDVKACSSTLSRLQGSEQSLLIDDAPSSTVHNLHAFLAFGKAFIVKQTLGTSKRNSTSCWWTLRHRYNRPTYDWCLAHQQ